MPAFCREERGDSSDDETSDTCQESEAALASPKSSSAVTASGRFCALLRRPHWDGYTEEEKRASCHLFAAEIYVLPFIIVLYAIFAWFAAPDDDHRIPESPTWVVVLEWVCTILAVHVLYVSVFCVMYPTADQTDNFGTTSGPLGRYIWLTRQTISLQAVHLALSLAAPSFSARLAAGTYAMTAPVGGLAIFITVQFFLLARPTPEHQDDCKMWEARGVPFAFHADYTHVPAGIIAIVEAVIVKQRALLLKRMPHLAWIVLGYFIYVLTYVAVMHTNFRLTSCWPYGFLKDLGMDPFKWTKFVLTQFVILVIFMLISWVLPQVIPALW